MKVGIIDYGSGNFASVWNAFSQQEERMVTVTEPGEIPDCTHLVLPGVGAFSTAMERLEHMGLLQPIKDVLLDGKTPFLGICVGMQILATEGTEFSPTAGLNAVSGRVDRFAFQDQENRLPLPHMGWNEVIPCPDSILFRGIDPEETSFYFVHSYHLESNERSVKFSYCEYGYGFIAAVEKGLIFGVQFHPEKSQRNGQLLIANFLRLQGG